MTNVLKDLSDGHHTFRELYDERAALICALAAARPEITWKSKCHYDEENDPMYDGDFIVGFDAPEGVVAYHLKLDYWKHCPARILHHAPPYDGYASEEANRRILSLVEGALLR